MAENYIKYSARTYDDYRQSIMELAKQYYPDVFKTLDDASVGSFLIDVVSDVGDSLNHHIDRTYQETALESANQRKSLLKIARNNGVRVPGRKAAMVEVELSVELPVGNATGDNNGVADETFAPVVKKGTLFSTGTATFELVNNVDFKSQFNENGISDRQMIPQRDSNGNIRSYLYKKLGIAVAGQSKIYKRVIDSKDIEPFMTITLNDANILGVESIILKEGSNLNTEPNIDEFNVDLERYKYGMSSNSQTWRYFEVDNLADQFRYGYMVQESEGDYKTYSPVIAEVVDPNDNTKKICQVVKGYWKRVKQKFTTEYTDNGSLKITFGSGIENQYGNIPRGASEFTQYMMSRMEANDYMGILPRSGWTMYVLYRVGGGEISNIQPNTLNTVVYQKMELDGCPDASKANQVKNSLRVTNPYTSYGGKDAPSNEEIRQLIKCNTASQNRCVTLHDYEAKIITLPAKYGTPFRCSVIEENNKVVIYTLGLDYEGHLMPNLSEVVAENIKTYLSKYRMINDLVEIRPGKVINVAIEVDVFVDKTYEKADVVKNIINLVYDYMDIRHHLMGEEIFLGDLEKEISKLDGVVNLIDLRCYNKVGSTEGYSDTRTTQEMVQNDDCCYGSDGESDVNTSNMINLKASDKILYSEPASMIELKYKDKDILVTVKER